MTASGDPLPATGCDVLLGDEARLQPLRGARVGLLAHAASITRDHVHLLDALLARGVRPQRLFGPEHGLRGEAQDMIPVEGGVDALSGIPCVSLYGHDEPSLTPRRADLEGLDVLLVDLQDVGSRYYTYVYTAMLAVEAAAAAGVHCVILDRPNPLGGRWEGSPVMPGFESFVGMLPLPQRHGLTLAEVLAFARTHGRDVPCEVIPASGWNREASDPMAGFPWVLPSPNMPTVDTARVYPGLCLLEGTNLSEGRGTTRPFEIFGAPWIDAHRLRETLLALELPGVHFRPLGFRPTFQKWAGQTCLGLQLHVTDPERFRPLRTGVAIVWACASLFPDAFAWRAEAYEFVADRPAIDLLFGNDRPRLLIEAGAPFEEVLATVLSDVDDPARAMALRPEYGAGTG